jgi:hypothetical protein
MPGVILLQVPLPSSKKGDPCLPNWVLSQQMSTTSSGRQQMFSRGWQKSLILLYTGVIISDYDNIIYFIASAFFYLFLFVHTDCTRTFYFEISIKDKNNNNNTQNTKQQCLSLLAYSGTTLPRMFTFLSFYFILPENSCF